MRMIDKRGQEQSTTVTWVIALIILVLAVFAIYWAYNTFKQGTFPWQKSTISITAQACSVACTGNDKAAYCSETKTIKLTQQDYNSFKTKIGGDIVDNKLGGFNVDETKRIVSGTCNQFAKNANLVDWGIEACEQIECT